MNRKLIPTLADVMNEYYGEDDLRELCELFDVVPDSEETHTDFGYASSRISYFKFARRLIANSEFGNNRLFLETIVPNLMSRCERAIASTNWERRDYHQGLVARIQELFSLLGDPKVPSEVTVTENQPFTAKSEAREFLERAETPVTIVDAYIGVGTLDCLRGVKHPIRILTGVGGKSIEAGFDRALRDFQGEGYGVEVKRHHKLHDRYILFNDRCWLVGSSLKDAGKKTFSVIEFIDARLIIAAEIERKWTEATSLII